MNALPPTSALLDLTGRVALVTGGAKGIGLGIARRLVDAGAAVLVTDVDTAAGEAAVGALGARASFLHADGGSVADAVGAVDACYRTWGRLDVLVNNAGIFPSSPALETTEALWDRVMDVNLKGAFFLSQAAARRMVAARTPGSIVNIASIDAFHPTGSLVHYDASKAGMVMLTRSLAMELGRHGIRVNVVGGGGGGGGKEEREKTKSFGEG
ncbi:MAG: SDR family NAD(P)-dependent oxidoreductase, partial [Myxococcota bacterium]